MATPSLFPFRLLLVTLVAVTLSLGLPAEDEAPDTLSLSGTWRCERDQADRGVAERWFTRDLALSATLPGTLDTNRIGDETPFVPKPRSAVEPRKDYLSWSRRHRHVGPAWYQRDIDIPAGWHGHQVRLSLERCMWESRAWIDGRELGRQDSLCTPHLHELGILEPGRHRLTLRIDNTLRHDLGNSWADWSNTVSEQTQPNWNGAIGALRLEAMDVVHIDECQVFPDMVRRVVRVRVTVSNASGTAVPATVTLAVRGPAGFATVPVALSAMIRNGLMVVEGEVVLGPQARLWSESDPALYELEARVAGSVGEAPCAHHVTTTFGLRQFEVTPGKMFALNGRTILLRGTLENCVFPLTGHPAMGVADWERILSICRDYGLNHLRFHSWCPPEAAFSAADRMGFLLQAELPVWIHDWGRQPARDRWVGEEMHRILRAYGNHPSFAMLSMGNEAAGDLAIPAELTREAKLADPRHLYIRSSAWGPGPYDDYDQRGGPVPWNKQEGMRGAGGPSTDWDHGRTIAASRVPLVTHELGQYAVYPDFGEIPKYTGVLRVWNYELIRDHLTAQGMADQAMDFTCASGRLAALLYVADLQAARRTRGLAGFQMLDLRDFPGQGTSLVGMLDTFWDAKGLISAEEFRHNTAPTAVLARLPGRCFVAGGRIAVRAEVSHFGPADLRGCATRWSLEREDGGEVAAGALDPVDIPTGQVTELGRFEVSLDGLAAPARYRLAIALGEGRARNAWDIWVYPAAAAEDPAGVTIATAWPGDARAALERGGAVALLIDGKGLARSTGTGFYPVFWSPVLFGDNAGTMGLLCDPHHPALARFPTAMHADWQWFELVDNTCALVLDGLAPDLRPIVQPIDNFVRNQHLGSVFAVRVGSGRLLVSTLRLGGDLAQRPAARQMRASLLGWFAGVDPATLPAWIMAKVEGLMEPAKPRPTATH